MQIRVPVVRSSRARRRRPHDGGREFARSMGKDAKREETRDDACCPLRDGNLPNKIVTLEETLCMALLHETA